MYARIGRRLTHNQIWRTCASNSELSIKFWPRLCLLMIQCRVVSPWIVTESHTLEKTEIHTQSQRVPNYMIVISQNCGCHVHWNVASVMQSRNHNFLFSVCTSSPPPYYDSRNRCSRKFVIVRYFVCPRDISRGTPIKNCLSLCLYVIHVRRTRSLRRIVCVLQMNEIHVRCSGISV